MGPYWKPILHNSTIFPFPTKLMYAKFLKQCLTSEYNKSSNNLCNLTSYKIFFKKASVWKDLQQDLLDPDPYLNRGNSS